VDIQNPYAESVKHFRTENARASYHPDVRVQLPQQGNNLVGIQVTHLYDPTPAYSVCTRPVRIALWPSGQLGVQSLHRNRKGVKNPESANQSGNPSRQAALL
jgi:hypothetical protein